MKIYICNAFSLSMLDADVQRSDNLRVPMPIGSNADARDWLSHRREGVEIVSAVGHADTSAVFSTLLGIPVAANRISVKLTDDSDALIGQYTGPRLPVGATELPEGASIEWWVV